MSTTSVQDWWLLPRVYQSSLWFLVSSPHFMHSPWILSMPLLCCRNDPQCSSFGIQLKSLAKVKNGSCVFKNILILTTMSGAPAPQVLCSARWAHRTFLHTYQNRLYMTVIFISISPLITNSTAYAELALDPAQCKSLEGSYFWGLFDFCILSCQRFYYQHCALNRTVHQ